MRNELTSRLIECYLCEHVHIHKCMCVRAHVCGEAGTWPKLITLRSSCVMGEGEPVRGAVGATLPLVPGVLPGHPGTLPTLTCRDVSVIFDWV